MENNVKLIELYSGYDNMESKRVLRERLKEAACIGNVDAVQELINLGVDVNTQHSVNGWTPLHWACKLGHIDVVALLLKNGADKNIRSESGEIPASLCSNPQILQLLGTHPDSQRILNDSAIHNVKTQYFKTDFSHRPVESGHSRLQNNLVNAKDELVLKIRVAGTSDPDFIEIELPHNDLTYQALVRICCQELNLDPNYIIKLRKLPNTKLRKDKDIQRLQNFQEIEVVVHSLGMYKGALSSSDVPNNIPTVPVNGYQSISKKDQTILY